MASTHFFSDIIFTVSINFIDDKTVSFSNVQNHVMEICDFFWSLLLTLLFKTSNIYPLRKSNILLSLPNQALRTLTQQQTLNPLTVTRFMSS